MKTETKIKILFIARICMWITAVISTVYWIGYSAKLTYVDEIYLPEEYAPLLRPVLYPCLIITFVAICISFALYGQSKKLKKQLQDEVRYSE